MPNNELGKLRRSAVLMSYGPGAIIDFRAGKQGAAVSVVSAGLEQWDDRTYSKGLAHPQTIFEPRLQKKLGVLGFRMPPVFPDDDSPEPLLGVRFPNWLQCPSCDTIADVRSRHWASEPGDPARYCSQCSAGKPVTQKVSVVPVRFVTACQNGHLDDFPWHIWVQHKADCENKKELKLHTRGSGLAGLHVVCPECDAAKSMEKIFKKEALAHLKCWGRHPHLQGENEGCDLKPLTLQRGASNLYFPKTYSALDIPPWSDLVQKMLGQYWGPITTMPEVLGRENFIRSIWDLLSLPDMTVEDLVKNVEHRLKMIDEPERENLRWDEYQQLCTSGGINSPDKEFEIRESDLPESLENYLSLLIRAVRLREVRAQTSFTRIEPPSNKVEEGKIPIMPAQLSKKMHNWLPAIEVRGEGIFIQFNKDKLYEWENTEIVRERVKSVTPEMIDSMALDLNENKVVSDNITARFLLIHTLAHMLMKQLSLECGYSSASLRERLFIGDAPEEMYGLLIYTSTSDSDGTLGGLQRQGLPHRFEDMFIQSIRSNEWCSSDPLCIEGVSSTTEATNLAACHSCVLAPETSCEEFNRFLDRGLVVGTPDKPELGFFRDLLQH